MINSRSARVLERLPSGGSSRVRRWLSRRHQSRGHGVTKSTYHAFGLIALAVAVFAFIIYALRERAATDGHIAETPANAWAFELGLCSTDLERRRAAWNTLALAIADLGESSPPRQAGGRILTMDVLAEYRNKFNDTPKQDRVRILRKGLRDEDQSIKLHALFVIGIVAHARGDSDIWSSTLTELKGDVEHVSDSASGDLKTQADHVLRMMSKRRISATALSQ